MREDEKCKLLERLCLYLEKQRVSSEMVVENEETSTIWRTILFDHLGEWSWIPFYDKKNVAYEKNVHTKECAYQRMSRCKQHWDFEEMGS